MTRSSHRHRSISGPRVALLLCAGAMAAITGCSTEARAPAVEIEIDDSVLRTTECDGFGARAECFRATVPEDRSHPDRRDIELLVVRVPARSAESREPVLFFPAAPARPPPT